MVTSGQKGVLRSYLNRKAVPTAEVRGMRGQGVEEYDPKSGRVVGR